MSARFSLMVTALRHRNFQLFFAGQGVILLGASIRQVALNWLVYRSTHSVLLLGLAAFAGKLPLLIGMPLAGVVADRWDKRRTIMFTQSLGIATRRPNDSPSWWCCFLCCRRDFRTKNAVADERS
jgi:MFS family permease